MAKRNSILAKALGAAAKKCETAEELQVLIAETLVEFPDGDDNDRSALVGQAWDAFEKRTGQVTRPGDPIGPTTVSQDADQDAVNHKHLDFCLDEFASGFNPNDGPELSAEKVLEGAGCPYLLISADNPFGMKVMVALSHWAAAAHDVDAETRRAFREKVREFELWREANK